MRISNTQINLYEAFIEFYLYAYYGAEIFIFFYNLPKIYRRVLLNT